MMKKLKKLFSNKYHAIYTVIIILFVIIFLKDIQGQSFLSNPITKTGNNLNIITSIPNENITDNYRGTQSLIALGENFYTTHELQTIIQQKQFPLSYKNLLIVLQLMQAQQFKLAQQLLSKINQNTKNITLEENELYLALVAQISFHNKNYDKLFQISEQYIENYYRTERFSLMFYYYIFSGNKIKQKPQHTELFSNDLYSYLTIQQANTLKKIFVTRALKGKKYSKALLYIIQNDAISTQDHSLLEEILLSFNDIDILEEIEETVNSPKIFLQILEKKIELLYQSVDRDNTIYNVQVLKINYSEQYPQILDDIEKYNSFFFTETKPPYKIGVLLPLSYKNKLIQKIIQETIVGLNLYFQENSINKKNIQLIFFDTELKDEKIEEGIRFLVDIENVIAIIGPLSKNASLLANKVATEHKVPLISFSLSEQIAQNYPYAYRYQRSSFNEIETIADYALDYLNAKKFVIFYDNQQNHLKSQVFLQHIIERGGEIVAIENIQPNQVDFRKNFRRITGIYRYLASSEREYFNEIIDIKNKKASFDAIFFATDLPTINKIIPFLAAYNAEHSSLLLTSEANNFSLISLKNSDAYFSDFFSYNTSNPVNHFLNLYRREKILDKEIGSFSSYSIFAYEVLELLETTIRIYNINNRIILNNYLSKTKNFPLLTGNIDINQDGEIVKPYHLYKKDKNHIKKIF